MLKNPTPRQIGLLISFYLALVTVPFVVIAQFIAPMPQGLWFLPLPLVLGTAAYFIVIRFLRVYIYRKIKVIYKSIHKQKLLPEEQRDNDMDMGRDIIGDVEKEVEVWSKGQRKHLDKYKNWAEYRRKFVGDISHELKTPIFNIQGYLHTLIEGGLHDEKVNMSFLKKAVKNVERLHTVVEDLGAISRLESGELILDLQVFDLKELVEDVFEELEIKATKKGITLAFKEGAETPYKVRADRENIRQIMINLVDNSIKYGKQDGHTLVGFYDMDRNVLVEVADDGIGIPKKHLNHVFDRFYRVDKSRSRAQGGSGLGLSIVKHILEAHQQTINVRSTPNVGSTFGFTLEKV